MAGPAAGCACSARDFETRLRRQSLPPKTGRISRPKEQPETQRCCLEALLTAFRRMRHARSCSSKNRSYTSNRSKRRIVYHNNLQVVLSNPRRAIRRLENYWSTMTRFPTKLQTVSDAPEPFRTSLADNIPSGEFIRFLVHAPAFSTGTQNSPAAVLAITGKGWLVASENEDGGISVEKATFDETLFVEMASILISGRLTIHFATVGTSYSVAMKFDMVEVDYYLKAIRLILDGIDRKSSAASGTVPDSASMTESWPWKFRADVQRYRPPGQPILAAVQWPAVNAAFQRELSPAGALLVTDSELVLISEEDASPLQSGAIITYFPVARLADFHVGHHGRFGFLALQVHAAHGGEKLEIMFPPGCEQVVSRGMEHVLVPANNYL
jgi:hypothetical protein